MDSNNDVITSIALKYKGNPMSCAGNNSIMPLNTRNELVVEEATDWSVVFNYSRLYGSKSCRDDKCYRLF